MQRAVSLTTGGRVTIPQEIRKQLGLQPHDHVTITLDGDHAVLRRVGGSIRASQGAAAGRVPPLTIQEEREAFEQGVADEVMSETE